MDLLEEGNKIDSNVNLSENSKINLKEIIGEIYALGFQMGKERNRFKSDEVYKEWSAGKPNENYLDAT